MIVASVSRKQQLVTIVLTLPSIYAAPQSLELYYLLQYFNLSCFIDMHLCVQTQRLILTAASEVELWCKKDFSSFCLPLWDDVSFPSVVRIGIEGFDTYTYLPKFVRSFWWQL